MNILIWLAVFYVGLVLLVYLAQRKLQYFPTTSDPALPIDPRFSSVVDVEFTSADGVQLKAWHWPGAKPATVLLFHGNGGNRSHRMDWMANLRSTGAGFFLLDYRGYGGSHGSPSEEGLYLDARAARDWVLEHAPGDLVYLGESLGCSIAVDLAAEHPPAAMVLQSGALSLVDVARSAYPFLPVGALMKDRYDSTEKIRSIGCPLLAIHGGRDRIIPMRLGRELFDAAGEPKEWFEVPRGDHNDMAWVGGEPYYERIREFLTRSVRGLR